MLHVGLDLGRRKVDVCLLSGQGEHLDQLAVPPEGDALRSLPRSLPSTVTARSSPVVRPSWSASRVGPTATNPMTRSLRVGDKEGVAIVRGADRPGPRSRRQGSAGLLRSRHVAHLNSDVP